MKDAPRLSKPEKVRTVHDLCRDPGTRKRTHRGLIRALASVFGGKDERKS